MGPLIVVFPDCFTALGGNQYVNSSRDRPLRRLPDARARAVRRPASSARSRRASIAAASASRRAATARSCTGCSTRGIGARSPTTRATRISTSSTAPTGRTRSTSSPSSAAHPQARHASTSPRAAKRAALRRPRRRPRRALPRARLAQDEARRRRGARDHEPCDGRDLRSGSRRRRTAFACRSTSRPASCCRARWRAGCATIRSIWSRAMRRQLQVAARHLHRLRLARPVSHPLRRASAVEARSPSTGVAHATRSSTTTTRTSTTGWT